MGMIATFYSFKGGVGRTMALANIASVLISRGKSVLTVDFDLEAPGLEHYFTHFQSRSSKRGGLLDLLMDVLRSPHTSDFPNWRDYISEIDVGHPQHLNLMNATGNSSKYGLDLTKFSWNSFFVDHNGGAFIESLRDAWKSEFDITLIDSRTGLTDSGGICTIQLPDVMVAVFTANRQSLHGLKDVVLRAQRARQQLAFDRMPLIVLPLPSRFDGRTEFEESQKWLKIFVEEMGEFFGDWLPKEVSARHVLERTKIPHVAYFSFGEKLPTLTHSIDDPESIGYAYATVANLLANDFQETRKIFGHSAKDEPDKLSDTKFDVFISYSAKDKLKVMELVHRLEESGLRVWVDDLQIQPGENILYRVEEGLERSRTLLLVMSHNTFGSEWVTLERQTALFRDPLNTERRFIPILIDNADLPDSLRRYKHIDLRDNSEKEYQLLIEACRQASRLGTHRH